MIKKETYHLYHATDYECAEKILKEGFIFKKNPEHWLGNGVYFFQDYSLAEWWATKPSGVFGAEVKKPAILNVDIKVKRENVLDLRDLKDYLEFSDIYRSEFLPKVVDGTIKVKVPRLLYRNRTEIIVTQKQMKKLRCAFCDYLKEQYELDMIIGTFNLPKQPYLPDEYGMAFKQFSLNYMETQFCVFNTKTIQNIEIGDDDQC